MADTFGEYQPGDIGSGDSEPDANGRASADASAPTFDAPPAEESVVAAPVVEEEPAPAEATRAAVAEASTEETETAEAGEAGATISADELADAELLEVEEVTTSRSEPSPYDRSGRWY